jgi:hypothetical protein
MKRKRAASDRAVFCATVRGIGLEVFPTCIADSFYLKRTSLLITITKLQKLTVFYKNYNKHASQFLCKIAAAHEKFAAHLQQIEHCVMAKFAATICSVEFVE